MKGPSGAFDLLGQVKSIQQVMPGEFSLLIGHETKSNFFLSLSISDGHLTPLTAKFLDVGMPVYSQVAPPANSELMHGYQAEISNNRIFLTARPDTAKP